MGWTAGGWPKGRADQFVAAAMRAPRRSARSARPQQQAAASRAPRRSLRTRCAGARAPRVKSPGQAAVKRDRSNPGQRAGTPRARWRRSARPPAPLGGGSPAGPRAGCRGPCGGPRRGPSPPPACERGAGRGGAGAGLAVRAATARRAAGLERGSGVGGTRLGGGRDGGGSACWRLHALAGATQTRGAAAHGQAQHDFACLRARVHARALQGRPPEHRERRGGGLHRRPLRRDGQEGADEGGHAAPRGGDERQQLHAWGGRLEGGWGAGASLAGAAGGLSQQSRPRSAARGPPSAPPLAGAARPTEPPPQPGPREGRG